MTGADRYILEMQIRDVKNAIEKYSKHKTARSVHVVGEATRRLKELEQKLESLTKEGK